MIVGRETYKKKREIFTSKIFRNKWLVTNECLYEQVCSKKCYLFYQQNKII